MTLATTSTDALLEGLRAYLLAYVPRAPLTGGTLQTRLAGRLYQVDPPDTLAYPFALMRLTGRATDGTHNGERETGDLEVMLYARPRSQRRALQQAGDVIVQAMLRYADGDAGGIVFSRRARRDDLPAPTGVADADVVQHRIVIPIVAWPAYLYQDTP